MSEHYLSLVDLTKAYGQHVAVQSISLNINEGELISLLGPSGCGKTTVLRMIAGLVTPTSGEVIVAGMPMSQVPANKRNIGMLFQQYALFPHMTVEDNVAFGLRMRRVPAVERKKSVDKALSLVKLSALAGRYPLQLSGGQQQRVALARALVLEPQVLLLDEPFGALDKNLRGSMQFELRELQRSLGITTVMVTHDQEEALILSDRVAIMSEGRLEQVGTGREVYHHPTTRFVADFMGECNIVPVQIEALLPASAVVRLAGNRLEVPLPNFDLRKSQSANLLLRPEQIEFSKKSEAATGLGATLVKQVFRGRDAHMTFSIGENFELKVIAPIRNPSDPLPENGAPYQLSWPSGAPQLMAL